MVQSEEPIEVCHQCNGIIEQFMVHSCLTVFTNNMNDKYNQIMSALLDLKLFIEKTRTVNKCPITRKKNK